MWKSKKHPRLKSGVNTWCPLNKLMMFNVIWDFTPDMMHIIGTFFERLVLGVFKGTREPTDTIVKPAKLTNPSSSAKQKQHKLDMVEYKRSKAEYDRESRKATKCTFTDKQQKEVDQRVKNLTGFPDWIKNTMVSAWSGVGHRIILGFSNSCE